MSLLPQRLLLACCIALISGESEAAERNEAQRWYPSLGLTSQYVIRGVSQNDGKTAAQAGLSYATPQRGRTSFYAGLWSSTPLASSRAGTWTPGTELDVYAGMRRTLGERWSFDLGVVRYLYPNDERPLDYQYTELVATLDYQGRVRATFTASPDTSLYTRRGVAHDRSAYSLGVTLEQPLAHGLALVGGVGYYDLSDLSGTGYGYWNGGITWQVGRVSVDLSHIRADSRGRALFGDRAGAHTVLTLVIGL